MRRYLILDDNRAFADNLGEILEDHGAEVVVVSDAQEALALAARERFDALVSDMRMPVMSGAEVVHQVRRIDPGLPALVITAYTNDDDLAAARQEGLLAVLPKPVPIPLLVEHLRVARRDGLVAIVEDDEQMADNLSELLRARGFTAVTAGSVLETKVLAPLRPFVAVVDLRMPDGPDGEAMRLLGERQPELPLLVITGLETDPPFSCRALFRKPFETRLLLEAIEREYAGRAVAG